MAKIPDTSEIKEIKEIKDLPKIHQRIYQVFLEYLEKNDPAKARKMVAPLLDLYTSMDWEVPEEIEINYARLYLLELKEEAEKNS